ncbi:MAG: TonB-dependent receptor [Bacteroidales bacterium]|nr:TonB-dependent receptor [Bacteroidales bacterium]
MNTPKSYLLAAALMTAAAQANAGDDVLRGLVRNTMGEPLPGVAVSVKDGTLRTVTDGNGRFSLASAASNQTLVFSYIGYESRETVATSDSIDVVMEEDNRQLGEVLVTTQKRAQTAIEVPVSVSALTGHNMADMQVRGMDEMSQFIPGLEVQVQSVNNPGYVIRGVTSDEGESYSQPRISVFTDGVSTSRSRASVAEIFDMERIEVVKGPQGTLFGRGAEIGAIHFLRHKPVDYLTGELSVNYGTHNQRGANGFINTPLSDKVQNRFAFSYDAHDGYVKNLAGGRLNGKSAIALRNSTRFLFTPKTKLDLVLDYQYDNAPGTAFKSQTLPTPGGNTSPFTDAYLEQGDNLGITRHVGGVTALLDHRLNDAWTLSSITGFRAFKSTEDFDADGSSLPLLFATEKEKGTQLSEEIRLNYDNGGRFSGFLGASYFFEHSQQQVIVRSDLQYLYPAVIGQQFSATYKPQFQQMVAGVDQMATALKAQYPAYSDAIDQMASGLGSQLSALIDQWFPASYDPTQAVTTTPDFYGDLNTAFNAFLQSNPMAQLLFSQLMGGTPTLDGLLTLMGQDAATLKQSSALPLSTEQQEEGTNYGENHAAEIFADGTFNIYKGLSLTAGLRGTYEHQRTGYSSSTVPSIFGAILYTPTTDNQRVYISDDYYSWVGRVALNYMFGRNNAYVSVSRGRRPGVLYFNNSADAQVRLKPEIIVSYEAGIKGNVLDGRLGYEACVYYYDWSHFQTSRLDAESSSIALNYVADDAGRAHTLGVELGLRYQICPLLNVFANYAYIDGKFNDTDDEGNAQEYAGNRFRLTPKNAFSVGLDLDVPVSTTAAVYFRPSYSYKSKVYFDDSNDPLLTQDGYGIANFTAGVRLNVKKLRYDFSLFGKNVFNEDYLVDAGNTGNTIGYPTYVAGSPSVFGVQVKVGF